MPIDTAEDRRAISGLWSLRIPGVTVNTLKDLEWRQQAAWSYSGIPTGGAPPAGPMPIGTVPVRYVFTIPNVVPVETVLVGGIGVVPVREFIGPANVVPVREAASEVPRVKVIKV